MRIEQILEETGQAKKLVETFRANMYYFAEVRRIERNLEEKRRTQAQLRRVRIAQGR